MIRKDLSIDRRTIIRDLIYAFISIRELADLYETSYSTMYKTIKRWRIAPPYDLTWPKGVGWQWAKNRLPVPNSLKDINRSEFSHLYRTHTQTELAERFDVTRKTIQRALKYHCIKRRSPKESHQLLQDRKHHKETMEKQEMQYRKMADIRASICRGCEHKLAIPYDLQTKLFNCKGNITLKNSSDERTSEYDNQNRRSG